MKVKTAEYCVELLFKELKKEKKKARKERKNLLKCQKIQSADYKRLMKMYEENAKDKECEAATIATENSLLMAQIETLKEEFGSAAVEKVLWRVDYDC